jgi:hypothetical protein
MTRPEPRMKTLSNTLLLAGSPGHGSHLLQGGSIAVCISGFQVSMLQVLSLGDWPISPHVKREPR